MSPRSQEENQRIRDERREAILAAAVEVFARMGLAQAKISDIAAAAGVSYGLVYHYFRTKEAVFGALIEQAAASMQGAAGWLAALPGTPRQRLEQLTAAMLDGLKAQPGHFLIALEALTKEGVPQGFRQTVWQSSEAFRGAVAEVVAAGQATGDIGPGAPGELATLYVASMQGLANMLAAMGPEAPDFPGPELLMRIFR